MESNGPFRASFEGAEHQLGYLVNGLWVYVYVSVINQATIQEFINGYTSSNISQTLIKCTRNKDMMGLTQSVL